MGEIIRKKVKAMNWKAKIAIVLCFTLLFSTFMYEGWYKPKPAYAATSVYKGSFAKLTTTGSQTISGLPFQPKAVIFFWTKNTVSGTVAANAVMGIGFAGGTTLANAAVVTSSQDNVGTTNTGWMESATYSIITLNPATPALAARASVTALNADGFTLNWQTSDGSADIIHYIAIGGTDITNVKVGQFNGPSVTGNFSYPGVGFQPDFVMLAHPDRTATTLDAIQASGALNIGMFTSTSQGAIGWGSRDGQTTITHAHTLSDAHSVYGIRRNAADQIATFVTMDANGFTLNYSTAGGSAPYIYIALKGGSHKIGSFTKRTSAGTQGVTGVGFQPTGLMLFSHNSTAINGTVETNDPAASLSIGAASGANVNGAVWMHEKTIINTDVNMISHTNLVMRMGASNNGITDYGQATLQSFDTGGFTLNWTSSDSTARRILYWAMGNASDTTPPVAGTVTVSPDVSGYTSSAPTITTQFTDNESTVTSCEYTTNGTTWAAGTLSGTAPTWTCTANPTGLTGTLTINMRATSTGGTGTGTAITRTVDSTAPTNGTLTATAGNGQVSLSWSGFSDAESGLHTTDSYKLVYLTTGFPNASCTNGTEITAVTTQTSYTHTGLTNGTTYYYRLCAIDNIGNVSSGATASATPQADNRTTAGTASATAASSTSISVSMPYTDDANGNNTYTVDYKLTSSGTWTNWVTNAPHTTSPYTTTITGLTTGQTYDVRMTYNDPDGVLGTNPQTITGIYLSSYSNDPMLHNSTNLSSNYWSANGGWGIPGGKYGAFVCETCHIPRATNIKGIKSTISTPDGSNWASSNTPNVTVNFQSFTTAATAMGNDNETRTSSTRICEVCHSQTSYHKYSQTATAHMGVTDCTQCHKHNQGFKPQGDCTLCHNASVSSPIAQSLGGPSTRRNVVAEFAQASSHKRSAGGTVTKEDCIVCHMEGDPSTWDINKTYHKNGYIDLRDPDTGARIKEAQWSGTGAGSLSSLTTDAQFLQFSRNLSVDLASDANYTKLAGIELNHCLKCHDADGAASTLARVPGGSATNPFGGTGTPINVYSQLATTNRSYHPVLGKQNNSYAAGTRMNAPWNITKTAGTTTSWGLLMTCWDCHAPNNASGTLTSTVTAHGSAKTAPGTVYVELRGSVWMTGAVSSTNNTTLCIRCHAGYDTQTASNHGTGSAFTSNTDGGMTLYLRYACYYCHAGNNGGGAGGIVIPTVRADAAADVHGYNTRKGGTAFSNPQYGYGFIRSEGFYSQGYIQQPASVGGTTYTAQCTGFNGSNGSTNCSRNNMGNYTPGGTY